MNYTHYIGIDVSKNTLDFAVLQGKEIMFQLQVTNDVTGIKDFMKQLKAAVTLKFKLNEAVFCMEHTGIYNQHLLHFLFNKKANICLEASVHIKMASGLQRGKSDKIDALRIAQYAYKNREELKLWQPKRQAVQQLKYYAALRNRLINAKKLLSIALQETEPFDKQAASKMKALSKSSVNALGNDIAKTEEAIDKLIKADEQLKRLFEIVTSVQGIGKVTATEMIITTNEFKDINDPKKFACYAGVAPFEHSSGTSIKGKARVSHKANKTVKSLLHMSALVAIYYNDDLKKYYERKLQENKNKMSIVNAVRNKLVHRVFACVRENKLYQKKYEPMFV
jgi:transposase